MPVVENSFKFYQFVEKLYEMGEVKFKNLFVDGTKIEANANRYTWVWKKSCIKNRDNVFEKLSALIDKINEEVLPDTGEDVVKNAAYVLAFIANVTLAVIAFVKFRRQDRNEQ